MRGLSYSVKAIVKARGEAADTRSEEISENNREVVYGVVEAAVDTDASIEETDRAWKKARWDCWGGKRPVVAF